MFNLNLFCLLLLLWLVADSPDKYDSRDVERLQSDDSLVEGYLMWRIYVVDDALKMIDESLQWRKEFGLNGTTLSSAETLVWSNFSLGPLFHIQFTDFICGLWLHA